MSPGDLDTALLRFARTTGHGRCRERVVARYSRSGEHAACWIALGLCGGALTEAWPRSVAEGRS